MSTTVCVMADTLYYPEGGGHRWVYLNWALGLQSLGFDVLWLEWRLPDSRADGVGHALSSLRGQLKPYGLGDRVGLISSGVQRRPVELADAALDLDAVADAELLLNFQYSLPVEVVRRFRRSVLIDIDPGLPQLWMASGQLEVAPHSVYFTTGETVGQPGARFPDAGRPWRYAPPCVALEWWRETPCLAGAPFTTVSHWFGSEWVTDGADLYLNDKRSGFLPFLDLPRLVPQPRELALCFGPDEDGAELKERGWRVRHAHEVASTPWEYQRYIGSSRGEFSCAKPSCVRFENAWISDRTLCFLSSGKPAVVQHTGRSRFLPDAEGLFRFRNLAEAARCLGDADRDYQRYCLAARALVEEYFAARRVVQKVLEVAIA